MPAPNPPAEWPEDIRTGPTPTHRDIYGLLGEISAKVDRLTERVGHENDDGEGGTGLTGRIIRTEAQLTGFGNLKNQAIGAFAGVTFFGALILLGVKAWVQNVMGAHA